MREELKGKKFLITGGTGSFGHAVTDRLLKEGAGEIIIFSRDEKKQFDMAKEYREDSRIRFVIGDVREYRSIRKAMNGVDYVFHAAALKQVPACEFYPEEAVKTNVLGGINVLDAAIEARVKKVIVLSTDKAAYPINAMGITKALIEKISVAKAKEQSGTVICRTRYGNVMASRGSVIPFFAKQLEMGQKITVTVPEMTRFMMTLEDAVDLVLFAFENGQPGDLLVQKAPAATIDTLAKAICELRGIDPTGRIEIIGERPGEKMNEVLVTKEEMANAEEYEHFYRILPDKHTLHYHESPQSHKKNIMESYSSDNTERLDIEGMKQLLKKLPMFQ